MATEFLVSSSCFAAVKNYLSFSYPWRLASTISRSITTQFVNYWCCSIFFPKTICLDSNKEKKDRALQTSSTWNMIFKPLPDEVKLTTKNTIHFNDIASSSSRSTTDICVAFVPHRLWVLSSATGSFIAWKVILWHSWLTLWDRCMTTGRINTIRAVV